MKIFKTLAWHVPRILLMVAVLGTAFLFAGTLMFVFVVAVAEIASATGAGGWWR